MTVIESIVKELRELPPAKLVAVAGYVHQLTEAGQKDRQDWLRRSHGSMSDADARACDDALASSRRLPTHGKPRQRRVAG